MEAVKQNGWALEFVNKELQTPEICMEAVKQNGRALKFVKEQTPEICMEAVKKNGIAIIYVEEQTPEICLEAVKKNGLNLEHVIEQTPEICLEAVKQDGRALEFVKNEEMAKLCFKFLEYKMSLSHLKEKTILTNEEIILILDFIRKKIENLEENFEFLENFLKERVLENKK